VSDDPGPFDEVPSMRDEPVVWDAARRRFVAAADRDVDVDDATRVAPAPPAAASRPSERRHVVIGPEYVGRSPGESTAPARPAPRTTPPATRAPKAPTGPPTPPPSPRRRAAPAPGPRDPRRTRRRIWRVILAILVALLLLVTGLFFFGWWQFSRIERVDVGNALSPGGGKGTNYLIVGSDSRQGISADSPNAGAFLGETVSGERTDTIMVLRIEGSKSYLLSIPRDLWVTNPATGEAGRINATYQSGPTALIRAVQNLGIPVHHYLEINFVSFADLVDAVGGITVDFPNPARDTHSGLDVPQAGKVHLDGTEALAYVRSRFYEELIDGRWVTDPTADLGRVQRQRTFLQALMGKVTGTKNPLTLANVASAMGGGMRIDDEMTYFDALGLAWHLRGGFNPESVTLPVTPTTRGGAAVLDLKQAEAAPLTQQFSA
jgi:LCP family protein required for cell wall assembly